MVVKCQSRQPIANILHILLRVRRYMSFRAINKALQLEAPRHRRLTSRATQILQPTQLIGRY